MHLTSLQNIEINNPETDYGWVEIISFIRVSIVVWCEIKYNIEYYGHLSWSVHFQVA